MHIYTYAYIHIHTHTHTHTHIGVVAATKAVLEQESNGRHLSRLRTPRAVFGDRLLRSFDEDNAAVFWQLRCVNRALLSRE